jgi:hypothetical protein
MTARICRNFARWLAACLVLASAAAHGWETPVATPPPATKLPLDLAVIDPHSKEKLPPYIVMFEEGQDDKGQDVRGPLGRLEALRGASKLFPESNKDAGLPVVLRGLRLHARLNTEGGVLGYELELQGEFNMVKVPAAKEDVEKFLAGEPVTFVLKGEKNYGVYSYVSTTTLEMQLRGDEVFIRRLEGDFTFREGFYTYASKTKKLKAPAGREYLFRGQRAPLPTLPSI